MTKCTYCGRTDRNCENEAQVIGCDPMPWSTRFDGAREVPSATTDSTALMPEVNNDSSLRGGLAARIREAYAVGTSCTVCLSQPFARAILAALQEADRRALEGTMTEAEWARRLK